jgi:hypothetical protein
MRKPFATIVIAVSCIAISTGALATPVSGHPPLACKQMKDRQKRCGFGVDSGGTDPGTGTDNSGQVNPQCYYTCRGGKSGKNDLGDDACVKSCQQ